MATTTAKDLLTEPVRKTVRIDLSLLQQVKDSAQRSLRSMNAEINHRLRGSFEHETTAS
jgi:hypothetical protein